MEVLEQRPLSSRHWPEADFHIVPDAGHVATEPDTTDELVEATDRFPTL